MDTVEAVFKKFGGPAAFSRAIGIKPSAASEMKRRASIPVEYWQKLVAAAKERGVHELTYEKLVKLHSKQKESAA